MSKYPMVKLGDVCEKGSSNIAQKDIANNVGEYPIYGASGLIKTIDFYRQENPYIAIVKDGAGVGRVMILPKQSSIIGTMQYIFPNDSIDISYLYYALQRLNLARYSTGATIPHIYFKDYSNERIPLPPLEEQRHIAEVLDKVTAQLDTCNLILTKLDLLVKAKFVQTFGDPVSNTMGWDTQKLGKLSNIIRGGSPRPINQYLGGDIPWIKISDATKGSDIYLYTTKEHIIKDGIKKSRYIKKGSLIFANCGVSLGFARIIQFDGCIHDGWLALQDIDENTLNKIFLLKSLNFCTEYFRKIAPDGTQPNLNIDIMSNFIQIVPPIELQNEFAGFVQRVERQKATAQATQNRLNTLKQALMQRYFS